jgi:hypothetical protein
LLNWARGSWGGSEKAGGRRDSEKRQESGEAARSRAVAKGNQPCGAGIPRWKGGEMWRNMLLFASSVCPSLAPGG